MGKGQFSDCDSDFSDGLPDLFPKCIFNVLKLIKNDIVWAAYKDLYWPALVRHVDKKNKKVKVWYLDSPGKCFTLPFKKIHDFHDAGFRKKVEDEAKLHPLGKIHDKILRRTDVFMYRRFIGIVDDPLEFFDLSKPYFLLKDFNLGISDIASDNKNASTEKIDKNENLNESSNNESAVESDMENWTTTKCFPELYKEDSPYDDEMVDKILSYITSSHVDSYLLDILNSKIANERHKLYGEAVKKDQVQLFVESQPSILINSQKLHNVLIYLHNLYKKDIGKDIPRMNEYIVSVWLPEAVNKAISLIESESSKLPDNSCGSNESCSPLETKVSNLIFDSGRDKFSNSLIAGFSNNVFNLPTESETSERLVDSSCNNISSTSQGEASESTTNSSSNNVFCELKRKVNPLSLDENHNVNELKTQACTSSKKRLIGRKRKKGCSKALKPRRNFDHVPESEAPLLKV